MLASGMSLEGFAAATWADHQRAVTLAERAAVRAWHTGGRVGLVWSGRLWVKPLVDTVLFHQEISFGYWRAFR